MNSGRADSRSLVPSAAAGSRQEVHKQHDRRQDANDDHREDDRLQEPSENVSTHPLTPFSEITATA